MSKATEDVLAQLHGKLAETMIASLKQSDRARELLVKYSRLDEEVNLPRDVAKFLEVACEVNPSLLTSAAKFLKDNNISCDPADDEALSDLETRLKAKRISSKGNVTKIEFED